MMHRPQKTLLQMHPTNNYRSPVRKKLIWKCVKSCWNIGIQKKGQIFVLNKITRSKLQYNQFLLDTSQSKKIFTMEHYTAKESAENFQVYIQKEPSISKNQDNRITLNGSVIECSKIWRDWKKVFFPKRNKRFFYMEYGVIVVWKKKSFVLFYQCSFYSQNLKGD